jgi:hypothetical protein
VWVAMCVLVWGKQPLTAVSASGDWRQIVGSEKNLGEQKTPYQHVVFSGLPHAFTSGVLAQRATWLSPAFGTT